MAHFQVLSAHMAMFQNYRFRIKPGFLIFFLFFMGLFVTLGFWQLDRYHSKKALLQAYDQRLDAEPKLISEIMQQTGNIQFQTARAKGQYLNSLTFLVQNRVYKDQLGYEVITPLQMPGEKKLLLVDRGWVAQTRHHTVPDIKPVNSEQDITGYIKLVNEYQFILGKNIMNPEHHPIVIQKINTDDMAAATQQEYFPFILRMDASEPHGFVRDWTISAVPPARHLGYAVQWFVMALVLFISYICFCCERRHESK